MHDTQDKPADPLITDASARKFAIDNDLGRKCIALLEGLSFPTYKQQVLDYLRALPPQKDADAVCSIVERLDPYRAYNSVDEILRITIVTEDPRAYMHEMMSEESRHRPDFALRGTNNDHGQSATTSTARSEEREDYPEVPPSAMRVYICNICGVNYGSPNELETHHKSTHKEVQSTETKHR